MLNLPKLSRFLRHQIVTAQMLEDRAMITQIFAVSTEDSRLHAFLGAFIEHMDKITGER